MHTHTYTRAHTLTVSFICSVFVFDVMSVYVSFLYLTANWFISYGFRRIYAKIKWKTILDRMLLCCVRAWVCALHWVNASLLYFVTVFWVHLLECDAFCVHCFRCFRCFCLRYASGNELSRKNTLMNDHQFQCKCSMKL